jgi:hypothetical protein
MEWKSKLELWPYLLIAIALVGMLCLVLISAR